MNNNGTSQQTLIKDRSKSGVGLSGGIVRELIVWYHLLNFNLVYFQKDNLLATSPKPSIDERIRRLEITKFLWDKYYLYDKKL